MSRNLIHRIGYATVAAVVLGVSLAAAAPSARTSPPDISSTDWNFEQEASDLLEEVQGLAGQLRQDASRLESFKLSRLSWQSHAAQLNSVREHINQIGDRLERLREIRHVTAPWQQQAIDRLVPTALSLASRTQAAIEHLNENPGHLLAPSYADHLTAIAEQAEALKTSVDDFLEYAETQQRLDRLRDTLGVS